MADDKRKQQAPIKSSIRHRVQWIYFTMLFVGLLILGKIVYIQYGPDGEKYRKEGRKANFGYFREVAFL